MRLPPVLMITLLLLAACSTALASKSHWTGVGFGNGSQVGNQCSIDITVEIDRNFDTPSTWDIWYLVVPTSTALCFFPSTYEFTSVPGSPQIGWRKSIVESCGTHLINIEPIGSLPAGLTTLTFQHGGCGGGGGNVSIVFAAEDPV